MTQYTTVIVTGIQSDDEDSINELDLLNSYLDSVGKKTLRELKNDYGFYGDVFGASINYFDERAFLKFCSEVDWYLPDNLQILIQSENELVYRLITIKALESLAK